MIEVGERAPEIDALTSRGDRFRLSAQLDKLCTVVFFFPKAFTPGCTAETKRFRDNYAELALAGARVVGISTDDQDTQCNFAESLRAPFPMIGDADKAISKAYGVLWPIVGRPRRVTFVILPDRIVAARFEHELQIARHRDDVLACVDQLHRLKRERGA